MFGKRPWLRLLVALLIVTLLPVANVAGFAFRPAVAEGSEPILLLESEVLVDGNFVVLPFYVTDPAYEPEVDKLIHLGDNTEVSPFLYDFWYDENEGVYVFEAWDLESGEHALFLNMTKNGLVEMSISYAFVVPEKRPLSVYLFGPEEEINLVFRNAETNEPVAHEAFRSVEGNYWKYTIYAHSNEAFLISADGYLLSIEEDYLYGRKQWDYVAHAVETYFAVDLRESDIRFDPVTGYITGYLRFAGVGYSDNYRVTVITDGGVYEACDVIDDDIEMGDTFVCQVAVGETPLKVRIDYLTVDGPEATNAAVNLAHVGLPGNVVIQDTDPVIGSAMPYVAFTGSQASDISLYKIVPPVRDDYIEPDHVQYIPADGQPVYEVLLEAFDAYPGDRVTIRMVDKNGHEYNDALAVPIVDSMTDQQGLIDYAGWGCNNAMTLSYYYCLDAEAFEYELEHDDSEYADGSLSWSVPDTGAYRIVAYDLYFANGDGSDIAGFARVNIDPESQTFSHPLTNIPSGADRVAVIPLLIDAEDEGFTYATVYYAEPFHVSLPAGSAPEELIVLNDWGLFEGEGGAWFEWEIFHDDPYDLYVRVYRMPEDEPVPDPDYFLYQNDSLVYVDVTLPPGTYKVVLELEGENVTARNEKTITLTGVPLNIFLFGADADTQVELYHYWDEYIVPYASREVFDGFVRYTYEINREAYYEFRSPDNPALGQIIYPYYQLDYVMHLEQLPYQADLAEYDIHAEGSSISGTFRFYGSEYLYRLVFTDQNGDVIGACVEEIEASPWNEPGNLVEFQCGLPSGAKDLRLDAVVDGLPFATNLLLHLDPIEPPGQISIEDLNDEIDWLDLAVRFTDSPDASNLALYMVHISGGYGTRYFPAGEGDYEFEMRDLYSYWGDRFFIRMIGRDGHEYISYKKLPLGDRISALTGDIDFVCEGAGGFYCETFEPLEDEDLVPSDANYATGRVGWTLPDTGDFELLTYDLYYANEDREIIRGDVRIHSPALFDGGTVIHELADVPQNAAYMAVVTLLYAEGENHERFYHFLQPFFIPLDEEEPAELVEDSDFVLLGGGSYGYIQKGMTAGDVLDKFRFASGAEGAIRIGEIELDRSDPMSPGAVLIVTLGEREEAFGLRFLSELLRPSGTEPISVAHVVSFVIGQLAAGEPIDLTGDGTFDRVDVRLLLGELDH